MRTCCFVTAGVLLGNPMTDLAAVRQALAALPSDAPRETISLELPLGIDRIMGPRWQKKLRSASVLVPIIDRPDGATVLLTQRSDALKEHAGQISFPGGSAEPGDADAAATAIREAKEEVGLAPELVTVLGLLGDYPTVTRFCITPVIARVAPQAQFTLDHNEVSAVFELPLHLAMDRAAYARKTIGRMGLEVPYYELNYDGWRIWGATAGMLKALADMVHAHG
ncbi:CoA pyrophosphatase [bacterium]|nr:CoA pyrophosphatase [bacterium]